MTPEAARRAKLVALRALGIEPFAYRFERTHMAAEAIALFEASEQPVNFYAVSSNLYVYDTEAICKSPT